ncbi:MAG TPA: hypothetical protein VHB48_20475 [Chitinophagaceae bacterium]|nr:hypothetical protein [Chitinophagaceae bacterium]
MRILFLFIFVILTGRNVLAQQTDAEIIHTLLKQLDSAQYRQSRGDFYAGMFEGFRSCGGGPHNYQPDNNIFFTAVTAFGMRNLLPKLTGENRLLAQAIYRRASTSYPLYKNKYGMPYYGFWDASGTFMPHAYIFQHLKQVFGEGEDADDTVMILMSSDNGDSTARIVKKRMVAVSNLKNGRRIKSTYKKYRNIPAYSTWMGDRMPRDFDFSVQCNIMYFILDSKLPFTTQDSATIHLLAEMVKNREYMKDPTFISPYYVHSSILLYHLARLMGAFKIEQLEAYKPQLVQDIHSLLATSHNVMDQIILRTSLLRLGEKAPELDLHSVREFEESNQKTFIFFQARAAFSYPVPFKKIFLHFSYICHYFYCPSYNKFLWLEYLVEKNRVH